MKPAEMLAKAIAIASDKHMGQFDRGGAPYVLHVLTVAHYLESSDMELMAVAVLHDVVEDTNTTFEDLKEAGMSDRIVEAVRLLTKMPGQTIREYLDGIKTNKDAIAVKLADLRHNSDIRRLKGISEKDIERIKKYQSMYFELKNLAC